MCVISEYFKHTNTNSVFTFVNLRINISYKYGSFTGFCIKLVYLISSILCHCMSLFHTRVSKHLKLEEFDQAQHQASMQVRAAAATLCLECIKSLSFVDVNHAGFVVNLCFMVCTLKSLV